MAYQYYPGHMTKAVRSMENDIKMIDLVIELVDARIPQSSKNPDIDRLAGQKSRLIIMNKSDLADPAVNKQWKEYYSGKGFVVIEADSKNRATLKGFEAAVNSSCREKIERDKRRGIINSSVKAMVVGIPNVGKSTFINTVSGKSGAKTGNKPGVTRGKQWITLGKNIELLDTPGILWPKFEDEITGRNLALIGSMNDEILNIEELCIDAINLLKCDYPESLIGRFGNELDISGTAADILCDMALIRNIIAKGNEPDIRRMSSVFIDELRSGKLGRVSFEKPF